MKNYLDLLKKVLDEGEYREGRTNVGYLSIFGESLNFDLKNSKLPLTTTKKLHLPSIIHELLWMISGDTNTKYLEDNGVTIWREWQDNSGGLGPIYGAQWRKWGGALNHPGVDQLKGVIKEIKENPNSRRLLVSAWNVDELSNMALPPCHVMFQFYVQRGELTCQMYQRSADIFLGLPFNIASYALLTHMVAKVTGLEAGALRVVIGDAHLYVNHINQAREQLSRYVSPHCPWVRIHGEHISIDSIKYGDITVSGYDPHPAIPGKVAV